MTTTRTITTFAAALLLPLAPATAQDQATTLLALARGADVVLVARVDAATDPTPEWHRLELATVQLLKGTAPQRFAVLEPAGACCGRSLFALGAGDVRLWFLSRRGGAWHPFGGARGVVPAAPAVVAHVGTLLAANDDGALARDLVAALDAEDPRVADDAAHALAVLPTLRLRGPDRDRLAAALRQTIELGTTRAVALADAAARDADDVLVDALLAGYVNARDAEAAMLRGALRRCGSPSVVARLPLVVAGDRQAVRAAELLVELPDDAARAGLEQLLRRSQHPRLLLCVAETLLANGGRGQELAARVPAPVLALAEQRAQRPRPLRNVDPRRR
jgi:hypothetical protein